MAGCLGRGVRCNRLQRDHWLTLGEEVAADVAPVAKHGVTESRPLSIAQITSGELVDSVTIGFIAYVIAEIVPTEFVRRVSNGKTRPAILLADHEDGAVEVVCKLAAGCERGPTSLAMEVVSALLAGDLGIPIPEPLFVLLEPEFLDALPDAAWAAMARNGPPVALGSKLLPTAYNAWVTGTLPVGQMTAVAASILLFDAVIENPDRRGANPNCLVRGDDIRVFDHELAFPPLLIGVPKPWVLGALQFMETPGMHIFRDALFNREVDWTPVVERWKGLSDAQLDDYEAVLPASWAAAKASYLSAIDKIKNVRDNIDGCVAEVQRVLS